MTALEERLNVSHTTRKAFAELIGSALLAATVVGSGIAAQTLSPDDTGLQLLENAVITGGVLVALILALGPVSAAFNPVVTLVELALGALSARLAALLIAAQVAGCCLGVVVANLMFELDAVNVSDRDRDIFLFVHRNRCARAPFFTRESERDRWSKFLLVRWCFR